jgi:zinc/manganese transport system substrate-binding protein
MRLLWASALVCFACAAPVSAGVNVVTTTEDLAAIVREVAGPELKVRALLSGDKDPIAPRRLTADMPEALLRADLLIAIGSGLEDRWLPVVLSASHNGAVQPGARGYLDLSSGVDLLLVVANAVPSPAETSAPPPGNPHYWLDPANGHRLAKAIVKALSTLHAARAGEFARRAQDFERRLSEGEARWSTTLAPFKGKKLAAYDTTWRYFGERYGIEMLPAERLAEADYKLLLIEPFVDAQAASALAAKTGGRVLLLPSSVGGVKAATGYVALFDEIVARLLAASRQARENPR